jgi:hypothetical protein
MVRIQLPSRGESTNHRFRRRFHGLVFRVDAVKLELFVEVGGLPKAPHNVRRADLVGIRYQALTVYSPTKGLIAFGPICARMSEASLLIKPLMAPKMCSDSCTWKNKYSERL